MNILILKDNYNSFEQYYLDKLNECGIDAEFYVVDIGDGARRTV